MENNKIGKFIFTITFLAEIFAAGAFSWNNSRTVLMKDWNSILAAVHSDQKVSEAVSDMNADINSNVYRRMDMIEAYGLLNRLIGKKEINGFEYVIDKNGYLNSGNFWSVVHDKDIDTLVLNTEKMNLLLEKSGTKLLVVGFPQKYSEKWTDGHSGIPYDNLQIEMDEFLRGIRTYRIPCVDCKKILEKSGLKYSEMFFKTDHHWRSQAAFVCYRKITDQIEQMGFDVDPDGYYRDINNYTQKTYKGMMLGSEGRAVGINYAGTEDFTLMYLDDGSEYHMEQTAEGGTRNQYDGKVTESLLDFNVPGNIEKHPEQIYYNSLYDMYMHGVKTETSVVNKSNPDGLKVLMLRDSFADPIAVYMAPYCSQIDMIWTKYSTADTIQKYLDRNHYDLVIVGQYSDDLSDNFFDLPMAEVKKTSTH